MKEKRRLHMIGNAHIDPVWLWQWQEGYQEIKATFRSALDRMSEYDGFIFTCSSAAFYEWVETNAPEMFEEIRKRVAEGRWKVVGGWWVQPDCNIPSGESFVRQGLYGQHYFIKAFGRVARTGYNVDSFGHNAMLPQIIRKSGMDNYVFMRPMPVEKRLPGRLFWWEACDGSRVLSYRIPYEYCTWGRDLQDHIIRCAAQIQAPIREMMAFYGVGNHGGGPTKENIESIQRLNGEKGLPELRFSDPDTYFASIRAMAKPAGDQSDEGRPGEIPVYNGGLQHHASGCYAAHSGIKQRNRQAENRLLAAEKFSALASLLMQAAYPETFPLAWRQLLFNQFHDILAGTSLKEAYEDARNMHGEAIAIADRNLNAAVQRLSWAIDIEEDPAMRPIVVFNPHSWSAQVPVEMEFGRYGAGDYLTTEGGEPVLHQLLQSSATSNGRHRLNFIAEVPALGYRVYKLVSAGEGALSGSSAIGPAEESAAGLPERTEEQPYQVSADECSMENGWFRIEFDPETGCIRELLDKRSSFACITDKEGGLAGGSRQGARLVVMDDPSDTWGHGVYTFDEYLGDAEVEYVKLVEYGPVKAVIAVASRWGNSRIVQQFGMYSELEQIDVHVAVDWREKHQMLKLRFPVNLDFRSATTEIPYGHIERPANGEEYPGQSWIDISGQGRKRRELYGLSLANDAKYSYSFDRDVMDMTILRSPVYANHDPKKPDADREYRYMDQGLQEFSYTLLPHAGGWQNSEIVQVAAQLNQPPVLIMETGHAGVLPQRDSCIEIDRGNVVLTALKLAEAGDALILRCHETLKEESEATISLPKWGVSFSTVFKPCEIKTFRIPLRTEGGNAGNPLDSDAVAEVNLLELTGDEMRQFRE